MPELYIKKGRRYIKLGELDLNSLAVLKENMADGLWMVRTTPNSKGYRLVHKLCETPVRPELFAGLMKMGEDLALHIGTYKMNYCKSTKQNQWAPSNQEEADEILRWMGERMGVKFKPEIEYNVPIEASEHYRRLEIDL